jgi:aspartyl/glutamyl-tRNA(Asn/Gln) amidotransferase C subunit
VDIRISRLAELSRIDFSPEELEELEGDMQSIIALMDSLRNVELPEGETDYGGETTLPLLREDEAMESLPAALLTKSSPEGGDFRIPRIIE